MEKAAALLEDHKLRKTTIRLQVLDLFLQAKAALSSNRIEQQLDKIDRITLYRTLKTFEKEGLIHKAIDGSDKAKYALCSEACSPEHHHDNHAHFRCGDCGRTYCLDQVEAPRINVPDGFQVDASYLVLEGVCEACS